MVLYQVGKLISAYRYLLKFEKYNPHPDFPAVDLKERASAFTSRHSVTCLSKVSRGYELGTGWAC